MKRILFIFAVLSLSACKITQRKQAPLKPLPVVEYKTEDDKVILVGKINRKNLLSEKFAWFQEEYYSYKIPQKWATKELISKAKALRFKIFIGTWCSDTQRELGRIFRLLDALEVADAQIEMFALTKAKDSPQGFERDMEVFSVPTLIFYESGKELNRIVEHPIKNLYDDMAKIINKKPYQHAYYDN